MIVGAAKQAMQKRQAQEAKTRDTQAQATNTNQNQDVININLAHSWQKKEAGNNKIGFCLCQETPQIPPLKIDTHPEGIQPENIKETPIDSATLDKKNLTG